MTNETAQEFKAEKLGTVENLGDIYQVVAPLDEQILTFQREGIQHPYLADPQEIVEVRLVGVSDTYTRTSLMPVAVEDEPTILIRPSEIMTYFSALEAVNAHSNGNYLTRPREFYERAKQMAQSQKVDEPEDRTVMIVSKKGDQSLTPEMPLTRFILGRAQEYFDAKKHNSIPFWDLLGDSKTHATVNYLWFDDPVSGSVLYCRGGGFDGRDGALGVLKTAEGGSPRISRYDLTTIKNANSRAVEKFLEQRKLTGLSDKLDGLDEVLLEELRNSTK